MGTDFWKHLQGKDPSTLVELYAQAEPYKRVEQSLVENKKVDSTTPSKYKNKKRERSPSPENRGRRRSPNRVNVANTKRKWSPTPSYKTYTPLTAPLVHIFKLNKWKTIFKKPEPLNFFQSRDKKKYCEYHESTGHDTYECRHMKDEIKALIKEGYLTEWVKKDVRNYRGDVLGNQKDIREIKKRKSLRRIGL